MIILARESSREIGGIGSLGSRSSEVQDIRRRQMTDDERETRGQAGQIHTNGHKFFRHGLTQINTATKRQKINRKFEMRNPGEMRKTGEIPENPVVSTY